MSADGAEGLEDVLAGRRNSDFVEQGGRITKRRDRQDHKRLIREANEVKRMRERSGRIRTIAQIGPLDLGDDQRPAYSEKPRHHGRSPVRRALEAIRDSFRQQPAEPVAPDPFRGVESTGFGPDRRFGK